MNKRYWKKQGLEIYINTLILLQSLKKIGATEEMIRQAFIKFLISYLSRKRKFPEKTRVRNVKIFIAYIFTERKTSKQIAKEHKIHHVRVDQIKKMKIVIRRYPYSLLREQVYWELFEKLVIEPQS